MPAFEPVVYFRDAIVPASQAGIAYYDFGIILGATVTDLVRTYRHRPFRLDDHLNRFYESVQVRSHPASVESGGDPRRHPGIA